MRHVIPQGNDCVLKVGGPFLKGKQVQEVENYLESSPINSTLKKAMKSKRNQSINFKDDYKELSNIARAKNNSVFSNPMDTIGYNPDEPIKSAGTLMIEGYGAYQAEKQAVIRVKGGSVSKVKYKTAQGKKRYSFRANDPNDSFGLRKKSYPSYSLNRLNRGKLRSAHALISPKSALAESFSPKTMAGKLGYAGLGISAVSDITQGINKHQSGSRITGNVVGDTAVGVTAILASASTGAAVGAMAGSWAGPVGMAAGFVVGMGVNYLLSGVKPFHGKSVKDVVSNAAAKATKKVKHFLDIYFKEMVLRRDYLWIKRNLINIWYYHSSQMKSAFIHS